MCDIPKQLCAALAHPEPLIAVVGDVVEDVTAVLHGEHKSSGQEVATISRHRGGSAANIAAGIASLGTRSRFYGRVGHDVRGTRLVEALSEESVEVRPRLSGVSASVICLVRADGSRSLIADSNLVDGRSLHDVPEVDLQSVNVLHLSGFWLFGGSVDITGVADWSSQYGVVLTLDLGDLSLMRAAEPQEVNNAIRILRPAVVFSNRVEAVAADLLSAPRRGEIVVITDGPRPTVLLGDSYSYFVDVPPTPVVIDSTGAGDAFVAGFLHAATGSSNAIRAIEAGHATAAKSLMHAGATAHRGLDF